jgi:hypothetical protein
LEKSKDNVIPIETDAKFREKYYPDPDDKSNDEISRAAFLHSFGGDRAEMFSSLDLSKMEFPDPEWIADGIIPEGFSLLAGKQKVGKSFFTLALAAAVSTGTPFLGQFACKQRGVLYVSLEENKRAIWDRLEKIKALPSADLNFVFDTSKPNLGAIPGYIERFPKTGLIIIDTLGRFLKQFDMNDYAQSLEAVHAIKKISEDCNVSIFPTHHTRKSSADDFIDSVSGSNAITATADTTMVLIRRRGDKTGYIMGTGRNVLEYEHALNFEGADGGWNYLGTGDEIRASEEQRALIEALQEAGEPIGPKDLAAMTGQLYGTVRVMCFRLSRGGVIRKHGRGLYTTND